MKWQKCSKEGFWAECADDDQKTRQEPQDEKKTPNDNQKGMQEHQNSSKTEFDELNK